MSVKCEARVDCKLCKAAIRSFENFPWISNSLNVFACEMEILGKLGIFPCIDHLVRKNMWSRVQGESNNSNKYVFRVKLTASHKNCITSTSSLRHAAINSQIARSTSHPMLFYVPSEFEIKYLLINTFVFMYRMHLTNWLFHNILFSIGTSWKLFHRASLDFKAVRSRFVCDVSQWIQTIICMV